MAWLVHDVVPFAHALYWLELFSFGWCLNLLALRQLAKAGPGVARHARKLLVAAGIDGACWGLLALTLMSYDHRVDAWLVVVLCGVISVNVPTYVTYPRAFHVLATTMWLTVAGSITVLRSGIDAPLQMVMGLLVYSLVSVYTIRPISERVIEGIRLQLENAALAERLRQNLELVKHQANTDALTGHLNRRALDQRLERLVVDGDRRGPAFSLLMLDIDFFKRINDTHGHGVGDQALQSVAQRISAPLRNGDLCARFGGEEFVVLLPSTGSAQACEVAERIRLAVAESPLATDPPLAVTVSNGVATYAAGMGAETLLNTADREVYSAKRNGRNQVSAPATTGLAAINADAPIETSAAKQA